MNIKSIRTALASQITLSVGLTARPFELPITAVSYPCITVKLQPGDSITYQETMGDYDPDLLLDVEVRCRGNVDKAQEDLSAFLSTTGERSIVAAVDLDRTLQGTVMSIQPATATIAETPTTADGDHVALIHFRVMVG